jgi:hypothetical protein
MPGEVNRTGLIPADVLTRLLAQAANEPSDWCLTTVDQTGRVVTHSRTKHDPTVAQKRFVQARDRTCTYPGCARRAERCDVDHRVPWEKGGPTCPCNLHPLCRRHHRIKQADGWTVTRDPATGITTWTTPHDVIGHNDTDTLDPHLHQRWPHRGQPPSDSQPPGGADPPNPPGDTESADPPGDPPATAA